MSIKIITTCHIFLFFVKNSLLDTCLILKHYIYNYFLKYNIITLYIKNYFEYKNKSKQQLTLLKLEF
jgi:hypothetical protein